MDHCGQTRRQILKAAIGSAAGMMLGAPVRRAFAQTASQSPNIQRLSDDLFVVTIPGEANVVAQIVRRLRRCGACRRRVGRRVRRADEGVAGLSGRRSVHGRSSIRIGTPSRPARTNRLGKAGAAIIAHENTRLWLTTDVTWPWNGRRFTRLPKIAQPNKTFYTTGQLESGVRYGYIPDAAHTDGDLYVHFPKQNVLAVGTSSRAKAGPSSTTHRRMDWRHRRRPSTAADARRRGNADRAGPGTGARPVRISRHNTRCMARSTTG